MAGGRARSSLWFHPHVCGGTAAGTLVTFDVRSTSPDGHKRYIEVKARAGMGPVALTQNEWFKARRFQDEYFLYAVLNTASRPELYRIQNPAEVLKPEERVEVRYLVRRKTSSGRAREIDVLARELMVKCLYQIDKWRQSK